MTFDNVIIREAQAVLDYLEIITNETSKLLLTPEETAKMKLIDEINFLKESLKSFSSLFLLAIKDEKIIGTANMKSFLRSRISHRGTFGMSVLKDFRGKGISFRVSKEVAELWKELVEYDRKHYKGNTRYYPKMTFEKIVGDQLKIVKEFH